MSRISKTLENKTKTNKCFWSSLLLGDSIGVGYLLENVVLFRHYDQLQIGSTFLYHLHHLGVRFAHDRLSIDTHHLVT